MSIRIHPHAMVRMLERGATLSEVETTVEKGESFAAKHGRSMFRRNFVFNSSWQERRYSTKQVEVIAVQEEGAWLVITVLVRYF